MILSGYVAMNYCTYYVMYKIITKIHHANMKGNNIVLYDARACFYTLQELETCCMNDKTISFHDTLSITHLVL